MITPFYLQDEWIKIITETAQSICRESYPDYMIHESDVLVTLKALSVVAIASKREKVGKRTQKRIKCPLALKVHL